MLLNTLASAVANNNGSIIIDVRTLDKNGRGILLSSFDARLRRLPGCWLLLTTDPSIVQYCGLFEGGKKLIVGSVRIVLENR